MVAKRWTKRWWKAIAERTISTAAESFIGAIGSFMLLSEVDWPVIASAVALATLVSFAKNFIIKPGEVKNEEIIIDQ